MPKPNIYTVGGAVQAGGGLYIQRQADNDLLKLCREGAFAYVLTSRQVGKSSLMVRAAEQLAGENIRSVIVDLTVFGVQITAEAWYLGLLTAISDRLNLSTDVVEWWRSRAQFGDTQRLTEFFQNVLLAEVKERVVIFIDEIDSTLSLPAANGQPFTDDFYAAIRYLYNARATVPDFRRLSFVLIGVATPGDLIRDPKRTPFNIGSRVDITDFTFDEALPLADGLDLPTDGAKQVLRWVIKWTGGHPYLTQRLCRVVAEQYRNNWTEVEVDRTVANTFFGKMSEHDNNLQFVRDMLTRRAPDKLAVLSTYKDVRLSRLPVRDEEQSPIKSHLKLSGVVKREDGKLHVRNPIYRDVFNKGWIQEYWPVSWFATVPKSVKIAASLTIILFIVSVVLLAKFIATNYKLNQTLAALQTSIQNERTATSEAKRQTTEAERQRIRAEQEAENTKRSALEARQARDKAEQSARAEAAANAEAQNKTQLAKQKEKEAIAARDTANTRKKALEHSLRLEKARLLFSQAPLQQQEGKPELGLLLACQAFLFNKREQGPYNKQIHEVLIKTLKGAGSPIPTLPHHAVVRTVVFSPKSGVLASAGDDGAIRLWNLPKNATEVVLSEHQQSVKSVAFSPDGQQLASGSLDHTVRLWNLRESQPRATVLNGHRNEVWTVAFSPDGRTLASAGADSVVMLWRPHEPNGGAPIKLKHKAKVRAVTFSANGQWLASGDDDGTIRLYQLSHLDAANFIERKHQAKIKSLAFHPDRNILACGDADGKILLWEVGAAGEPLKERWQLVAHGAGTNVNAVAFSADGKMLASGSLDRWVRIWNIDQRSNEPLLEFEHPGNVLSVAFSPDGNTLASGSDDADVRLWITQTELLAAKVCQVVKRSNLSEEEWREFVGAEIAYEKTCDNLPSGKINATKGAKDENK